MFPLFAFAALISAAAPANPSWFYISGNDSVARYVETSGMVVEGDSRTVLTLSAHAQPQVHGAYNLAMTMAFDCRKRLFRTLDYATLDEKGKVLTTEPSESTAYRVPGEGSFNELVMKFVCFGEGGTQVADPLADAEWRLWD